MTDGRAARNVASLRPHGAGFRLALQIARAELRGGLKDFWLFLACLVIGTAVMGAVGSLAESVKVSILSEAKTLLGGDVSLTTTNRPLSPEEEAFVKKWGTTTSVLEMRAMASFQDKVQLVELKGVTETYPLIGQLTSKTGVVSRIDQGTVLVAEDLLGRLGAKVGDVMTLGPESFKIAGVIDLEPDRIAGTFGLGPRVIARADDLARAGLTGNDELIKFHQHILLNNPADLFKFQTALKDLFPNASWQMRNFHDANQGTTRFVSRLQLFLTLAGLTTLLIGGVGILNATEAFMLHKMNSIAVMKAIGASEGFLFLCYAVLLGLISLLGVSIGALSGGVAAALILPYLASFFPVSGGSFHISALLEAALFGFLTISVFVVAILGRAVGVRPAVLFRSTGLVVAGQLPMRFIALNGFLLLCLMGCLVILSDDKEIAAGFIVSALASIFLLSGLARLLQSAARRVRFKRPFMRLAASNIARPGAATFSIILSIGISLTVLIALLIVEGNFRHEIGKTIPEQAPSLFFIDIQPAEREAFDALLANDKGVQNVVLRPMIRGRIVSLNGVPVEQARVKDEAKWALESDRGLSYAAEAPLGSPVVEGAWWAKDYKGPPVVSLDRKLAEGLGLKLGDQLGLNILGKTIICTIANLRDVNYLTLQINFSMILSPGPIEQFPATFIATAHVEGGIKSETEVIQKVTKAFPHISTVAVRDQLDVLTSLIDHISFAVRIIALITMFSGLLVLASSLVASLDRRSYDIAIFKVLGADRAEIMRGFAAEWLSLALTTSFIAACLGTVGAWLILRALHWSAFEPLPSVVLITSAAAILVMMVTGFIIHHRVLRRPSLGFLRNE